MSLLPNPNLSPTFSIINSLPSLTSQLPAKESDINTIINRFLTSGVLPPAHRVPLELEDLTSAPNLQQLLQAGAHMQAAWNVLPAELRDKVGRPEALFPFLDDPDNVPFLSRIGLIAPKPEAASTEEAPTTTNPPSEGAS